MIDEDDDPSDENSFASHPDRLPVLYALIWKAKGSDDDADDAFQARVPRLMEWLKSLKKSGYLVACGGGTFGARDGDLTIIKAHSLAEARELSAGSPLNEIGKTEIFLWDVFHAHFTSNVGWGG